MGLVKRAGMTAMVRTRNDRYWPKADLSSRPLPTQSGHSAFLKAVIQIDLDHQHRHRCDRARPVL
jgi:hypothetical protein